MPDFAARFTEGVTLERWDDPDVLVPVALPSRINPSPQRPHRYWLGTVGTLIEVQATIDGVEGPADVALDGRPLMSWFVETPSTAPNITSPSGYGSIRRFTPNAPGHYTLILRRKLGGGIIFHVDVAPA